MNRKIRREPADQPAKARVLHNDRVNARRNHGAQVFFGIREFVLEGQRVERHVAAHAAPVEKFH